MIELVVILLSGFALIRPPIGGWWIWPYYLSSSPLFFGPVSFTSAGPRRAWQLAVAAPLACVPAALPGNARLRPATTSRQLHAMALINYHSRLPPPPDYTIMIIS